MSERAESPWAAFLTFRPASGNRKTSYQRCGAWVRARQGHPPPPLHCKFFQSEVPIINLPRFLQIVTSAMPGRLLDPTCGELARRHWPHYSAILLLLLGLAASDLIPPQQHALYSGSDRQWWTYSRPTVSETLPDWSMPLLAVVLPLTVICTLATGRLEAHHMGLALLACVAASGLATNVLKTQVRGTALEASMFCAVVSKLLSQLPLHAGRPPPPRLCPEVLAKVACSHLFRPAQRPAGVRGQI